MRKGKDNRLLHERLINALLLVVIVSLFGCGNAKIDCVVGASTPTDLTLINDCDTDKEVSLFFFSPTKNAFEFMRTIEIEKGQRKTICIENEGPVTEGLYLKMTDRTKLVVLSEVQKSNLCDDSNVIEQYRGPK